MMNNDWNTCLFFNSYQANRDGQIRNEKSGRIMKPYRQKTGYVFVCLQHNGKSYTKTVHRLVWEAFNGPIPEGMDVNHINEDKTDNRLENLNLMTRKENINWGTCIERRRQKQRNNIRSKVILQYGLDGELVQEWPSEKEIERILGYNQGNISRCCSGVIKTSYNYIWRYKE